MDAAEAAPDSHVLVEFSGVEFSGHTEFFAELTGVPLPVMLLAGKQLPGLTVHTGDVLADKFGKLEQESGADDELAALKRKMGVLPPEAPKEAAAPKRIEASPGPAPAAPSRVEQAERDELAAALAELEAQEQAEQAARMKR